MGRAFEQVVRLKLEKFSPEAAKRKHIEIARKGLGAFMARQLEKPGYLIETDGRPSSSEEAVRPFGVIAYRFTRLREVVTFAIAEAQRLSPVQSGRYRKSWFAMADGRAIDVDAIAGNAREILITNDQPYSRKINVGAKGYERYARPGIVEKVKELVKKRYGRLVEVRVVYVTLAGGHKLQSDLRRKNRDGSRGNVRKDARKGSDITYPAVRITSKY